MDYKYMLNLVNSILKKYNFKRKSNNWHIEYDETIIVFNMQRSMYSACYYLNIGLNTKDINSANKFPKEYQCHFRIRLRSNSINNIDYFDLENEIIDNDRENGIKLFLEETVIKTINRISTINGLKEYCKENPSILLSNTWIKKYLGLLDNDIE
jgi:hypothetical protein